MTKEEMKRAAFAVSTIWDYPIGNEGFVDLAKEFNLNLEEIWPNNVRFNWTLKENDTICPDGNTDYVDDGLLEASMLLSEASREDFDYQEPEC